MAMRRLLEFVKDHRVRRTLTESDALYVLDHGNDNIKSFTPDALLINMHEARASLPVLFASLFSMKSLWERVRERVLSTHRRTAIDDVLSDDDGALGEPLVLRER
ncbi:hypothetical protein LTR85_000873 [Meristemomyces frigidus]|nr:hypothetical protein LTR85_000873 [Meristemomyces frigidus]